MKLKLSVPCVRPQTTRQRIVLHYLLLRRYCMVKLETHTHTTMKEGNTQTRIKGGIFIPGVTIRTSILIIPTSAIILTSHGEMILQPSCPSLHSLHNFRLIRGLQPTHTNLLIGDPYKTPSINSCKAKWEQIHKWLNSKNKPIEPWKTLEANWLSWTRHWV